ncbi:MAG TPA: hypothetical protein DCL35_08290 [Candidatus Omnitrophica bacterium]|nr:hypothetical protein [Candidatus Omnitrophota bacterium]
MIPRCFSFLRFLISLVKLTVVIACFLCYFLSAFFASLVFFFLKTPVKRLLVSRLIHIFNLCLVNIIGIRIKVTGAIGAVAAVGTGVFLVSNHLSYVDGFILGSLFPVIYVSKSDLKNWPLIGLMSDFSGTLYIDRNRKNHIAEYIGVIAETLSAGANVLFFPEGTSSNGDSLLPFKAAFFEAPLAAGAPIVPAAIIYSSVDGEPVGKNNRDRVYWHGDMTFADHFFRLLSCSRVDVEVRISPAIILKDEGDRGPLRKRACESAYEAILKGIDEGKRQREEER